MADLIYDVDYTSVKRANEEIEAIGTNAQRSASVFEKAFKRAEAQQRKSLTTINQQIAASKRLEAQKTKAANESVKALDAQRKAVQGNTVALSRMKATYDSSYAVEQRTLKLKQLLRQEIANGNMTVRQAGTELLAYRKNLIAYNQSQMATMKATNQLGVVTQQAGYQVGDFLVQVQSGTNPMVAFGQQATQLVGVLPLLSGHIGMSTTALIGLSTGLGIGIPLVTAIGAAFMRTGEKSEKSSKKIKTLNDRIEELGETIRKFHRDREAGNLGVSLDELFGLENIEMAESKVEEASKRLEEALGKAEAASMAGGFFGVSNKTLEAVKKAQQDLATAQVQLTLLRLEEQRKLEEGFAAHNNQVKLDFALDYFDSYVEAERKSLEANQSLRERQREHEAQTNLDNALAYFDSYQEGMSIAGASILAEQKRQAEEAAAHMKAVFENTVFRATLRFSTEFNVPLIYQDLISGALGDIDSSISRWERDKDKKGGGGSSDRESKLETLMNSLMTEQEKVEEWRANQLELLDEYNSAELEKIGGHAEAKLRIEQEYREKLLGIIGESTNRERDMVFDSGITILNALGQFNDKALKIAKVASAAKALINTYEGASEALKLPFPMNLAAAAKIIATGLGFVSSIKSVTSSGSVSGGSSSGGSVPSGSDAPISSTSSDAGPQRVIIEGITEDSLITGKMLVEIFDAFYEENSNRGYIFEVAR